MPASASCERQANCDVGVGVVELVGVGAGVWVNVGVAVWVDGGVAVGGTEGVGMGVADGGGKVAVAEEVGGKAVGAMVGRGVVEVADMGAELPAQLVCHNIPMSKNNHGNRTNQ